MTKKENTLTALQGGNPEKVVCYFDSVQFVPSGMTQETPPQINGRNAPGIDGFGVSHIPTESGGGAYTQDISVPPVIKDITEWKKYYKAPDYTEAEWKEGAALADKVLDRQTYVSDFISARGLFERMQLLLGFEETMMSLVEEPEACYDLAGAIADHKLRQLEMVAKYIKPDMFTMMDDFSHHRGLFLSVDTFRSVFKPHLQRIVDACKAYGITYKQHNCGKMEALLDDYLEMGITVIDPVQPMNNIPEMKKKTLGRACLMGGLDIQNVVDRPDYTEESIRQETRRCIEEYAGGGGYIIYGASICMRDPEARKPGGRIPAIIDDCRKYNGEK